MLKHLSLLIIKKPPVQPPSGGCVLKRTDKRLNDMTNFPAAFGRLCVETPFGNGDGEPDWGQPPSGGCVLKLESCGSSIQFIASRLRAAVC